MTSAPAEYDMAVYPMTMAVRSASDGASVHTVHLPWCDCADFTNRKGRQATADNGMPAVTICKHIAAALERVGGWHRGTPEPEVYSGLSQTDAKAILRSKAGLNLRQANTLLREATRTMSSFECKSAGKDLPDISISYDTLYARYEIKLTY